MKTFKKKITTEYSWSRFDGKDIPAEHLQELQDKAYDRMHQLIADGYCEGELYAIVGEYDIEYKGNWSSKKED